MRLRDLTTTAANAARIAELSDKLEGLPARGVPIGGGRHVDVALTWDLTGSVPIGWVSYRAVVNGGGLIANADTWLRANGSAHTLTPSERVELINLYSLARRANSRWSVRAW